jgi:hypothetical protein
MLDHGWTVRVISGGFAGTYCPDCAVALHMLPWSIQCAECGLQKTNEAAAERAGFLYFHDGHGGLEPLCRECSTMRSPRG